MRIFIIAVILGVMLLFGCSTKSLETNSGFSDDEEYVLEILKQIADLTKQRSLDEIFIIYAQNQVFKESYPIIIGDGVGVENSWVVAQNIGIIDSISEGRTSIYRGEKLIAKFEDGSNYGDMRDYLIARTFDKPIENGSVNTQYFGKSLLFVEFYIDDEDQLAIIKNQNLFRYLNMRITIEE